MMRIVLIGTGNVATRLGMALRAKNADIVQVFGRSGTDASRLASVLGCSFTTDVKNLATNAEVYLMAVSDDAISVLAAELSIKDHLIVHTAGSVSMDVLASGSINYGVLYPLQTLSVQKEVDFSHVPLCIEASSKANLEKLRMLAGTISDRVVEMDSQQRLQLHLAAVYVCNFVNHLYAIGDELLKEQNLDFNLLKPLISETAEKVMHFSPLDMQTGPAIRGNMAVMESHLDMLEQHPEWKKIYEIMSDNIKSLQKN
jgi:predicted short-subunit dehydrogenase-like oxidoreductase (DUF2520 family)